MKLHSLTSLRFFAAAFVVLGHLPLAARHSDFLQESFMGVTFFFVLSGFILSFSYADRIQQGRTSHSEFIASRFARIYPLHFLMMLGAIPLAVVAGYPAQKVAVQAAAHLTLTQAYIPDKSIFFSFNAPAWSLSVEMLFYSLFPLLAKARTGWLLSCAVTVLVFHIVQPLTDTQFSLYVFPPARLIDFILGILIYRLSFTRFQPRDRTVTLLQWSAVVLFALMFVARGAVPIAFRYDIYYLPPTALLIASFAWQQGQLSRALSGKVIVFLGECSFALYLVHQLVIRYGEVVRARISLPSALVPEPIFSFAYVLISVGLSVLLYQCFEQRAKLAVLSVLWPRNPSPPTPEASKSA